MLKRFSAFLRYSLAVVGLAVAGLAATQQASAAAFATTGHPNGGLLRNNMVTTVAVTGGNVNGERRVGNSSTATDTLNSVYLMALPPADEFNDQVSHDPSYSSLSFSYTQQDNAPTFSVDAYGVGHVGAPAMNTDWYFEGANDARTRAALGAGSTGVVTKLADSIISTGQTPGRLSTNGLATTDFLRSLYADGATSASYAAFRLNADADSNAVDPTSTGFDVVHGPPAAGSTHPALTVRPDIIALDTFAEESSGTMIGSVNSGTGFAGAWTASGAAPATVVAPTTELSLTNDDGQISGGSTAAEISGAFTGSNLNNTAMRRELATPFTGEELFVRYIVQIDSLDGDDRTFFTMWLDNESGADDDTHNDTSAFMGIRADNLAFARINSSGEQNVNVGAMSSGDTFTLVGRLYRAAPGDGFNRLAFWVDPDAADKGSPDGTVVIGGSNSGFSSVSHIGWRTGQFTGTGDTFLVDAIALGTTYASVVPVSVPEPMSAMLLALAGAAGLVRRRRHRR